MPLQTKCSQGRARAHIPTHLRHVVMETALIANRPTRGRFIGGANQDGEGGGGGSREPNYRFGASLISDVQLDFGRGRRRTASTAAATTCKCLYSLVPIESRHPQTSSDPRKQPEDLPPPTTQYNTRTNRDCQSSRPFQKVLVCP